MLKMISAALVIVIIAVAVVLKVRSGKFEAGIGNMRICPYCGHENDADVIFCENCGSSLISEEIVCSKCGHPVNYNEGICSVCGTKIVICAEETMLADDVYADYRQPYLEYFDNGLARRIHLSNKVTKIGSKNKYSDYILPSKKVSKVHAEIISENGEYFIKDTGSTNGTYLNDSTVRIAAGSEIRLNSGDKVRMADIELVFKSPGRI